MDNSTIDVFSAPTSERTASVWEWQPTQGAKAGVDKTVDFSKLRPGSLLTNCISSIEYPDSCQAELVAPPSANERLRVGLIRLKAC
ncbi:hypothetical protein M514_08511 [Trichuris suis]|uniref:Uncharacterized protein n=1 Tax=Trichuris suis TaxID=68888 RepID=A0A085M016_9BILA|nr:hypothetical protein M513_08511 [Trichuris suis]KFD67654.1 hypothetical protein M514_08511 [Trichuris suis]